MEKQLVPGRLSMLYYYHKTDDSLYKKLSPQESGFCPHSFLPNSSGILRPFGLKNPHITKN